MSTAVKTRPQIQDLTAVLDKGCNLIHCEITRFGTDESTAYATLKQLADDFRDFDANDNVANNGFVSASQETDTSIVITLVSANGKAKIDVVLHLDPCRLRDAATFSLNPALDNAVHIERALEPDMLVYRVNVSHMNEDGEQRLRAGAYKVYPRLHGGPSGKEGD